MSTLSRQLKRQLSLQSGAQDSHLIHGMFHRLENKLEKVRSWPGVTGAMLDAAMKDASDSGRIERFGAESLKKKGLNIVVSVYREDAPQTFVYARDRMAETFGDRFWQWPDASASGIGIGIGIDYGHGHVRYLQDGNGNVIVPVYKNQVRIEVVDLFANWDRKNGVVPRDVRNAKSAHFAVLFAAAQDPDWVMAMDGQKVPLALAGGLELDVPGRGPWTDVPSVHRGGHWVFLGGHWHDYRDRGTALPSLRE